VKPLAEKIGDFTDMGLALLYNFGSDTPQSKGRLLTCNPFAAQKRTEVAPRLDFAYTTEVAILSGEWNEITLECRKMLQLFHETEGKTSP
jgi:hypothetical protein